MAAVKNYGKRLRRPRKKDLLRIKEQLLKDYEDLNEIIDEKDEEISRLREVIADLELWFDDAKAEAHRIACSADITKAIIRDYRQDYGVMPPTVPAEDDDWDGK